LLSSFNDFAFVTIEGSGNVKSSAAATTQSLNCNITGSGDIDLLKISSQNADCTITGSGDISVAVSNSLKASIVGSGDIKYLGNPPILNTSITGSGNVIKL
jgi:hypothetical protein